jgi:hypothetical protein
LPIEYGLEGRGRRRPCRTAKRQMSAPRRGGRVFNTIYNILTQEGPVECLKNAARHLDEDGVFVVEAAPPWAWARGDKFIHVERITSGSVTLV